MKSKFIVAASILGFIFSTFSFANASNSEKTTGTSVNNLQVAVYSLAYSREEKIKVAFVNTTIEPVTIKILDGNNKVVYTEVVTDADRFGRNYNLSKLGKGTYFVQISNSAMINSKQVIIK